MKVTICVNNYLQFQGVNSVTDQFLLNAARFKSQGIHIDSIIDCQNVYHDVPDRSLSAKKSDDIKISLKKSKLYDTFLAKALITYKNYWKIGKKAASLALEYSSKNQQDVMIFEDAIAAYYYLRSKNDSANVIYMTHMFQDELEQFLMNNAAIKGTFVEKKLRDVYRFVYEKSDEIVTICQSASDSILNRFNKSSTIIYNSIEKFNVEERKETNNRVNFVVASSINHRKGSDLLCCVLEKLPQDYSSRSEFHIFGDGPFLREFEERMSKRENIHFYGSTQKPYLHYGTMDVLLLPSRLETLPMSIIEGMCAHLPIVASNVGATKELVDDKTTGILFDPSEESLMEAIKGSVDNRATLRQMGEEGYKKFCDHFESDIWVSRFVDLFKKMKGI